MWKRRKCFETHVRLLSRRARVGVPAERPWNAAACAAHAPTVRSARPRSGFNRGRRRERRNVTRLEGTAVPSSVSPELLSSALEVTALALMNSVFSIWLAEAKTTPFPLKSY